MDLAASIMVGFLGAPKRIDRPHFYITKVNQMRQADSQYLPHDTVYGNKYKHVLSAEDVASRYKAGSFHIFLTMQRQEKH